MCDWRSGERARLVAGFRPPAGGLPMLGGSSDRQSAVTLEWWDYGFEKSAHLEKLG